MNLTSCNVWIINIDSLYKIIKDYQYINIFISDDEFIQLVFDSINARLNKESNIDDYVYNWFFDEKINGIYNRFDAPIPYISTLIECIDEYYNWISIWETFIIDILTTYEQCRFTMIDKNTVIVRC